ncbi:MAG: hypothetical protein WC533_03465 [Candidatus Pacearchaeota archaeon]
MTEPTTFRKLKKALLELLRGYPSYRFFGKIESYLKESRSSLSVLGKDRIIEFASKEESKELNKKLTLEQWSQLRAEGKTEPIWYRLAPRGVDLAISMINLEYSERVLKYSETMRKLTILIIILTFLTLIFGLIGIFTKLPIIDILSFFR